MYYEPRRTSGDLSSRGGRMAYFATARITRLESDPSTQDHFYAYVADFLEFERHVPFREGKLYYESSLKRHDGGTNTVRFGRQVCALRSEASRVRKEGGDTGGIW